VQERAQSRSAQTKEIPMPQAATGLSEGRLVRWNQDQGYGCLRPDDGGKDVFVHVKVSPQNRPGQRAVTDWERRLSAGFARRGLDAPGVRSAALEQGERLCRAAGRRLRWCPCASPGDADAASSHDGAEPAGKPALPVSRASRQPAGGARQTALATSTRGH
jgi:hypothetical protein